MSKGRKLLGLGALFIPVPALASPDVSKDEIASIESNAKYADEAAAKAKAQGPVIYALIDGRPYKIEADKAPVAVTRTEFGTWLGETGPLLDAGGRPACGNVMSKAPDKCSTARSAAIEAREKAIAQQVATDVAKAKQRLAAQSRRGKK
jgi:hypothetical protein